jgi:hypothetical protein
MADDTNQKKASASLRVFISWSGERSKVLAQARGAEVAIVFAAGGV